MPPSDTRTRLAEILEPVVQGAGYDLEDLEVASAGRRTVVRVYVARDGGFTLDDVADVSRTLSATLDQHDGLVPGSYVLEVSSPGVDRPLTHPRHWRRNLGRLVAVRLLDGGEVTGRITASDDASAVLTVDGEDRTIAYDQIRRAQVQIEPRRSAEAAALLAAGDDFDLAGADVYADDLDADNDGDEDDGHDGDGDDGDGDEADGADDALYDEFDHADDDALDGLADYAGHVEYGRYDLPDDDPDEVAVDEFDDNFDFVDAEADRGDSADGSGDGRRRDSGPDPTG
jgi:ribosome maturation factor RimP